MNKVVGVPVLQVCAKRVPVGSRWLSANYLNGVCLCAVRV